MAKKCISTAKKKANFFETFTKAWVSILLVIALIDLQLSYVLAYIGRDQIAESLSIAVVTEIIGVAGIYMIRAFFDTFSQNKHFIEMTKMGMSTTVKSEDLPINNEDDENAVG